MSVIHPERINMAVPAYRTDQVIGIFSNTVSVSAPTALSSIVTVTDSKPHGFGDSCYPVGRFTTDGGATWNDMGAQIPNLATPTQPVFQTIDCQPTADPTNVTANISNYYDFVHGSGTAYTLTYEIYALAKNSMSAPVTPIHTNEIIAYSSSHNFQKVFMQGAASLNVGAGSIGSTSVAHNLGYVPRLRAFRLDSATPTVVRPLGYTIDSVEARLTGSSVTFYSDQTNFASAGIDCNIEYRIYLDG